MEIRLYKKGDLQQVAQLLGDTVPILDTQGYSETEVHSFAPNSIHFKDWNETCLTKFTVVAEADHEIVGIAQIDRSGHISCFYCHTNHRGKGLGRQLYNVLEEYATAKEISTIHTETGTFDRPFYFKMGFTTVQKQRLLINGEMVTKFVVKKELNN